MSYELPFKKGTKIIELGGGASPVYRPNVDYRPGPATDFTADFNEPFPIQSDEWDGVFGKYVLEHVSWRKVRGFIAEVYRILKPGGVAVMVTANLLEQARKLVEVGDAEQLEDRWVGMIFGDQDYVENLHRCGFSPEFAARLFREAGFQRVTILPFGELRTDMVIEATK